HNGVREGGLLVLTRRGIYSHASRCRARTLRTSEPYNTPYGIRPMLFDERDTSDLAGALEVLRGGFCDLPDCAIDDRDISAILNEAAVRLQDNYPYSRPLYAGQMLKPPHRLARLAYSLAMTINPNNHALDGGRASSAMEKEAVAEIAAMFGWTTHL